MEEKKESDVENLKKQLQECQNLKDEYLAGWQRTRADLLNYKKDEMERVGDVLKYACEGLVLKMLPLLDNFEIALQNFAKQNLGGQAENSSIVGGFSQIKKQFQDFLKEQGVQEIKSVGEKFDPNLHEVVEEIEAEGKESGTILEEVQKGYTINGRLLRPAKVKVVK
jgi:molecular chaperone GrpE